MAVSNLFQFFIQWHVTERCNLRCTHCYQSVPVVHHELSLREIRETVSEVSEMIDAWSERFDISFDRSINITGGEPFLRTDLFLIIEEIKQAGFEISVLTNGTIVDRDRAETLAVLGVDGVQVSIEGSEAVHDSIRGQGSFRAATAGAANMVASGIDVTLNMTLSNVNAGEVKNVSDLGADLGVKRIGFSRLVPSGNGRTLMNQMLSTDQLRDLYAALLSPAPEGIELVSGDPVAAQMRHAVIDDTGATAVGGCAAGLSGLTIAPDGMVLPCRRLPIPLGNVRTDSLRELWTTSPVLKALRDRSRYKGKCGRCSRWAKCRGCRAIAFATPGINGGHDFLSDDPQCFLHDH